jgi:hypothetical protein
MYRQQNAAQDHNIETANTSFDILAMFKYLRKAIKDQNYIQDKIKIRLNSGELVAIQLRTFIFPSVYKRKN